MTSDIYGIEELNRLIDKIYQIRGVPDIGRATGQGVDEYSSGLGNRCQSAEADGNQADWNQEKREKDMSDMRVETRVLGAASTSCYLVYSEGAEKAVIVDPADNAQFILNKRNELGTTPEAILLTHGHFNHIMAAEDVRRSFHVKIYTSETGDIMLPNPGLSLSGGWVGEQIGFHANMLLKDGDELKLIDSRWKMIEAPSHTTGSVCHYVPEEEVVFSGGTLFCEPYGRMDLFIRSSSQMVSSLLDRAFALPDDTMVYPGHGDTTTIEYEKKNNPIAFCR